MSIQRVASKWTKTNAILPNPALAAYIPETRLYTFEHLNEMLAVYGTVYIKPDNGTYGKGVMRAEKLTEPLPPTEEGIIGEKTWYVLRYDVDTLIFESMEEMYKEISARIRKRPYLIQRGIPLLQNEERPFDLRVLTQMNLRNQWETTLIIGRIAAPDKVITNHHSGGKVRFFNELMAPYLDVKETARLEQKLSKLGERVAWQLQKKFPRLKEIGLDVGLDQQIYPWILEVNTRPAIKVFTFLPNKSLYHKMFRYAVGYGRYSASTGKSVRSKRKA
ncbi:YheC/YheD family protein [Paenibacillus farraposensis]|uniref:YheC/YheD family protein n=1 Tax=Paenibacillus farraposensis TaxID=2807095 RepID=A0ABW4DIT7_9BACL|nr:YheC/YheD family protein [Paenibacillus farraposensis]MCC3378507.1 YheC/YheD family protein [Paenibacillus farraposensis]